MSAFWGRLTASRRKELFLKLTELLGESPGRILVQPIGSEDLERRHVLHQTAASQPEGKHSEPLKKHWEFPEPGAEKPTIVKF